MTQNIYDTAEFFERYSKLPRSVEGLAGAPEWSALRALLPDMPTVAGRGRSIVTSWKVRARRTASRGV
jgi:hypothetical protein